MMTFATLVAIAAGVIMLQMWESNTKRAQPIRVETEEELQKRYRGRR
ncbi:hypothetical protein [Neptuniibacter caesariensis]|uniref:Uncharacterized protein n=1 Tax=Neptuniibacter caesariensis TaxID=207954 RepID=A0A7U8C6S9_NEPCE|nr:hypothetical protein [Neptuniibacter caesariensis]EAR60951.1 hypothetical protein MED92_02091 [Oceanospirillum sp. MED92] [Neptuniibacter caesariensis]